MVYIHVVYVQVFLIRSRITYRREILLATHYLRYASASSDTMAAVWLNPHDTLVARGAPFPDPIPGTRVGSQKSTCPSPTPSCPPVVNLSLIHI